MIKNKTPEKPEIDNDCAYCRKKTYFCRSKICRVYKKQKWTNNQYKIMEILKEKKNGYEKQNNNMKKAKKKNIIIKEKKSTSLHRTSV